MIMGVYNRLNHTGKEVSLQRKERTADSAVGYPPLPLGKKNASDLEALKNMRYYYPK